MANNDLYESPLPRAVVQYHTGPAASTPLKKKLSNVGTSLPRVVWLVATLGLCHVFYKTWRLPPRANTHISVDLPLPVNANHGAVEWKGVLKKLKKEWKQISLGCALIFSLSIALLQIDLVLHSAVGRTTAIATFLFSGAGLVLSMTFRLVIHRSRDGKCPNKWIKASKTFDNLESMIFWSLLALPLSFLVWSVGLCVITVLVLSWAVQNGNANGDNEATRVGNIISVVFLTTLTLLVIGSVYQALKFVRKLC